MLLGFDTTVMIFLNFSQKYMLIMKEKRLYNILYPIKFAYSIILSSYA